MNTETGEIRSSEEMRKELNQVVKGQKAKERAKWVPLAGIPEEEIDLLRVMNTKERLEWLQRNSTRILKSCNRAQQNRLLAIGGLGLSRRQLREAGLKYRPNQVRLMAEKLGL